MSVTCPAATIWPAGGRAECAAEPALPRQGTQQETTSESQTRSARCGWRGPAVTPRAVAASVARPAAACPRIKRLGSNHALLARLRSPPR